MNKMTTTQRMRLFGMPPGTRYKVSPSIRLYRIVFAEVESNSLMDRPRQRGDTLRNGAAGNGRRKGRALDPAKHAGILAAATALFLERGLQATSMDLVAQRAGVSKMTVYSHFASKKALFSAIIDSLARQLTQAIDRLTLEEMPLEQALRQFGRQFVALALAPSSLALHRLVVAEAARTPALGRLIYESGPDQIARSLADYFARHPDVSVPDPRLAAEEFLGTLLGHAQLQLLLHARKPNELRGAVDTMVEHAVGIFCRGILDPRQREARRAG
jgi:TetR/AcrR family transcriptional repressor of mexJK operon